MKITNKLNLPLPILKAVENKHYDPGKSDITVTSLIGPTQINILKKRYGDQLVEDVADRIYALQGESIHTILERAGEVMPERYIVERRYYVDIDGVRLGGQIDVFDKDMAILQDYKVTSVWTAVNWPKQDYIMQANINAYLMRHGYYIDEKGDKVTSGLKVKGASIVAILRDWKKGEYKRELEDAKRRGYETTNYPSQQVVVLPVPMVDDATIEGYLKERVAENQAAKELPDDQLPECTEEERWAKPTTWAVMKAGGKRALKVASSEEEARVWAESRSDTYVQKRPGEQTRCNNYCPVREHCVQFKKLKKEKS